MAVNIYNIKVQELDTHDELALQPAECALALKPHQLASLKKCIRLETEEMQLDTTTSMRSKIGIIGDEVGSGKSFVVLSLIMSDAHVPDMPDVHSYGNNMIVVKMKEPFESAQLNMLIIPHNICTQWETYIKSFCPSLKYMMITKRKEYLNYLSANIQDYRLLIVSCTYYNTVVTDIRRRKIKLRRAIYDEVDSMNLQSAMEVSSIFYWFVTASYGNLLYPKAYHYYDRVQEKYTILSSGLRHSGFIKSLFVDLYDCKFVRDVIVKCKHDFINDSFKIPNPITHYIKCRSPASVAVLSGVVDRQVLDSLNAGDVATAIRLINQNNRSSEENIVDILIASLNKQKHNLELKYQYTQLMEFESGEAKEIALGRITSSMNEVVSKITHIQERIKSTNTCCICYDEMQNKTILACCSNTFCFKCINIWLSNKATCPLCKASVKRDAIYVVDEMQSEPQESFNTEEICEQNDKMTNLLYILENMNEESRILIFSGYERTLENIWSHVLSRISDRMSATYLKGNRASVDKIVDDYRQGKYQILLINSKEYGSGLNLENTTDIIMFHNFDNDLEKQVIGRAQRAGRTTPLNLWYLLHANEAQNLNPV